MLQLNDIDLISICTPSGLHPQHGILAARYGKHVLVEKPMAVQLQDADKLIKACCNARKSLFVVLQNRLNPAIGLLRKAIDEGRFGKIFLIASNVFWTRPQQYYDMAYWRGTRELDGGAFMNQGSHYIDMIQWLAGPVDSITAEIATLDRDIETEDFGSAIIRFHSGVIATINITMLAYPENLEGSITVLGKTGTARVGGIAMNRIEHWNFHDYQEYDEQINSISSNSSSVYGSGHSGYYTQVIKAIENKSRPRPASILLADGIEGKKSLAIVTAIYQSSRQNSSVFIKSR